MLDSTLAHRLELWGFEEGVMVFKDFSLGAAFGLQSIDISCMSDGSINELKSQIRQFLNGLESGLSLQFVQEIVPGNAGEIAAHESIGSGTTSPLVSEITTSRVKRYSELDDGGQLPRQNIYLLVRKSFRASSEQSRFSFLRRKPKELREEILRIEIEGFKRTLESLRKRPGSTP